MELEIEDDRVLRRYLLRSVDQAEQERIEQRLFSEDDYFQQLIVNEDELIDDYVNGALSAEEKASFEACFLSMPERRKKVRLAEALLAHAQRSSSPAQPLPQVVAKSTVSPARADSWPRRSLLGIAAMILVAGVLALLWMVMFRQLSADQKALTALNKAYPVHRPVESRLSGLDYSTFVETRGGAPADVNSAALGTAKSLVDNEPSDSSSPALRHVAGEVHLTEKNFDQAIADFRSALSADPNNAELHSDLAAAFFEKGKREESQSSFNQCVDEAGKALSLNPNLAAARFNRALCLEKAQPGAAAAEWQKYLDQDPGSKWADDAKRHLANLQSVPR